MERAEAEPQCRWYDWPVVVVLAYNTCALYGHLSRLILQIIHNTLLPEQPESFDAWCPWVGGIAALIASISTICGSYDKSVAVCLRNTMESFVRQASTLRIAVPILKTLAALWLSNLTYWDKFTLGFVAEGRRWQLGENDLYQIARNDSGASTDKSTSNSTSNSTSTSISVSTSASTGIDSTNVPADAVRALVATSFVALCGLSVASSITARSDVRSDPLPVDDCCGWFTITRKNEIGDSCYEFFTVREGTRSFDITTGDPREKVTVPVTMSTASPTTPDTNQSTAREVPSPAGAVSLTAEGVPSPPTAGKLPATNPDPELYQFKSPHNGFADESFGDSRQESLQSTHDSHKGDTIEGDSMDSKAIGDGE